MPLRSELGIPELIPLLVFLAVARLEKEKKDLQDQFGKELNELRGQTSALYEVRAMITIVTTI